MFELPGNQNYGPESDLPIEFMRESFGLQIMNYFYTKYNNSEIVREEFIEEFSIFVMTIIMNLSDDEIQMAESEIQVSTNFATPLLESEDLNDFFLAASNYFSNIVPLLDKNQIIRSKGELMRYLASNNEKNIFEPLLDLSN